MTKNSYFPQYGGIGSEQDLYQDLVDEQIKIFGMDVYYIPKTMLIDRALNDVVLSKFEDNVMIEMLLTSVDGFGGASSLNLAKFGLQIKDEVVFTVSKRRWTNYVTTEITTHVNGIPNEGDLIYVPMTQNTYEIKYVEREAPFYQLGKNYTYTLNCELYNPGNSIFNTGNSTLDNLEGESYIFPVTMKTGGTGTFSAGETVTQTYTEGSTQKTTTAKVVKWDTATRQLRLTYLVGNVKTNVAFVGQTSSANWVVNDFDTIDILIDNNAYDENRYYENKGDIIIDFTESNPFGEYGDMGGSF